MSTDKEERVKKLIEKEEFRNDTSIGKYIRILKALYRGNESKFDELTDIKGRKRQFIFKPSGSVKSRMKSRPRKIEGTPYFVITRINNRTKKKVIREAMDMLGYSEQVASAAIERLD